MRAANDDVLRERFGRVVHAGGNEGPYIGRNGVSVDRILSLVDQGLSDQQICQRIPKIDRKDILACKAYRVRFLEDALSAVYRERGDDPYFVLDENVSYLILPEVFRLFGPSTSVLAEGLYFQRNSDEHDVWKFAVEHGYRAILTQDSDFRGIAKRHRAGLMQNFNAAAAPKVIMIPHGLSLSGIVKVLNDYQGAIDDVVMGNEPYATYRITEDGMSRRDPDVIDYQVA